MQQDWKGINRYATVGLEFGISVLVGLFAGRWLQAKLGTGNWLTFLGFGFGIAAGYRAIYRAAQAAKRDAEREEAEERAARQRYHDEPSRASSDRSLPDDPALENPALEDPASSNGAPRSKHDLH